MNKTKQDSRDVREIEELLFGIYSAKEIQKLSVCKVDSSKIGGIDKNLYNTVYDPRMGTIENSVACETCGPTSSPWTCPGHFGHIELSEPIVHPLHYKRVIDFLRCFCIKCYRLLVTQDRIELNNMHRSIGIKRFSKIIEYLEKNDMCFVCSHPQPTYTFVTTDNTIQMSYKQKDKDKTKLSIILQVNEINAILDNVGDNDVRILGFNPDMMHPRNLVLTVFPVIPISARPYVVTDGNICDDDLTIQIIEIIKANNHLKVVDGEVIPDTKRTKYLQSLKFRISTFYNNSSGKAKHSTNGRAIKGIKERLTSKEGLIRQNLQGKRCEQSGRTVIGPDPTLHLDQVAVPDKMASTLTVPVQATNYNIEYLNNIINKGKANFVIKKTTGTRINIAHSLNYRGTLLEHGDIIIRKNKFNGLDENHLVMNGRNVLETGDKLIRNGLPVLDLNYPERRIYNVEIGDIVERHLIDGDMIILNRQPTLHMGSMLGMRVVVKSGKTLRVNLAICKSFNADMDGDEFNMHAPQTVEASTELRYISSAKQHIISPQGSNPNYCMVQDSLLGLYKMTLTSSKSMTKAQFFNIVIHLDMTPREILTRIGNIRRVLKLKGKKVRAFNGKGLFSMILPNDFYYEQKNTCDPSEPTVKIYKGVLYEGAINKAIVGATPRSLIKIINKEYGPDTASKFIDGSQTISNQWLLITGFSVGIEDCLVQGEEQSSKIKNAIHKCYIEAEAIKSTTSHPGIKEIRVSATLNKAKDIGLKIAQEYLNPHNNFLSTVRSGSKGDTYNLCQITGILGQQNLAGSRVKAVMNNGKRTLSHYPMDITDPEMEYESKGFIASSFIHGLNPRQFYFHCCSGRMGVSDTSMNTATSGYIQRRITKLTEDIKINYDGTVRDTLGSIYQTSYDDSGLNPITTVRVNGVSEMCDISSIVKKLNASTTK